MQFFKNKFIYIVIVFLIFSIILPFYAYATEDTSYVWSELSSDVIETSQTLSQDKRKFFKSYLW